MRTSVSAEMAMPSTVTAFSVKIALPGNTATELFIAREVMARWNARHTLGEKRILLPLDEECECPSTSNDLLVAFFCNSSRDLNPVLGNAEMEIEKQLKGGKPALIYFSDARVDLTGHPMPEGRALEDFKKRYAAATIDSYADEKEFRAKFTQQLEAIINGHPFFQAAKVESPAAAPAKVPVPDAPLSSCAREILVEACDDFEAYIGRIKVGTMLRIQANGKQLVEPQDAATIAKWDSAFHELLAGEYIRGAGLNGQLFQISTKGFAFLKTIGKTPVGYIAEMGGM